MSPHSYAKQYQQTSVSSAVLDADPHRLIALLFAGARERLRRAQACMQRGDMARKGECVSEVSLIIGSLDGALDHNAGGELAGNLSALYDYMQRRLVEANMHNDAAIMAEVDSLLGDVESAWNAIAPPAAQAVAVGAR